MTLAAELRAEASARPSSRAISESELLNTVDGTEYGPFYHWISRGAPTRFALIASDTAGGRGKLSSEPGKLNQDQLARALSLYYRDSLRDQTGAASEEDPPRKKNPKKKKKGKEEEDSLVRGSTQWHHRQGSRGWTAEMSTRKLRQRKAKADLWHVELIDHARHEYRQEYTASPPQVPAEANVFQSVLRPARLNEREKKRESHFDWELKRIKEVQKKESDSTARAAEKAEAHKRQEAGASGGGRQGAGEEVASPSPTKLEEMAQQATLDLLRAENAQRRRPRAGRPRHQFGARPSTAPASRGCGSRSP